MPDKKMLLLAAGIATAIFVTVVALVVIKHHGSGPVGFGCDLAGVAPSASRKAQNIHDDDFQGLASFLGYLQYEKEHNPSGAKSNSTILSLDFAAIKHDNQSKGASWNLVGDCAQLEVEQKTDWGPGLPGVAKMTVRVRKSAKADDYAQLCEVNPEHINWQPEMHYTCQETREYACQDAKTGAKIASLVIQRFEFEFGSKDSDHKQGKFGTRGAPCQKVE